jgi:hypothetical protein
VPEVSTVGPSSDGPEVQLTYNSDQDYWPAWTQDGQGILYSFVSPGSSVGHRCLGLLPARGGTRLWELCDNRAVRADSVSSYSAFALNSSGQLLVAEAVSGTRFNDLPLGVSLWLADTATPYARTTLLTMPVQVDTTVISWLSEITWTGPNSFLALGQRFTTAPRCLSPCFAPPDSVFVIADGVVIRGTIAGGHATIAAVAGTQGATAYSPAEGGAAIVFTLPHDLELHKVPIAGGAPVPTPNPGAHDTLSKQAGELVGVSCRAESCITARDGIIVTANYWQFVPNFGWQFTIALGSVLPGNNMELRRVSLLDGSDVVIRSGSAVFATPLVSPTSDDVVVAVGGAWGHLQTRQGPGPTGQGTLILYRGLAAP